MKPHSLNMNASRITIIFFFLLILCNKCYAIYPNNVSTSDLCSVVADELGNVHTTRTLYACAGTMQDPYTAITSISQYSDQNLTVETDMVINNLIEMNELENFVIIDLYFRWWWQDIRWVSYVSCVDIYVL